MCAVINLGFSGNVHQAEPEVGGTLQDAARRTPIVLVKSHLLRTRVPRASRKEKARWT